MSKLTDAKAASRQTDAQLAITRLIVETIWATADFYGKPVPSPEAVGTIAASVTQDRIRVARALYDGQA